jgi:hypothetical protein
MAIQGAALFLYLAGCKSEIQAGRFGYFVGYHPAFDYDDHVHLHFQPDIKGEQ